MDVVQQRTREIYNKFHIHGRDNLPFVGWYDTTRNHLIELFGEVGFKIGAEIGVRQGYNASVMFAKIPDLQLYCIDPWSAYLKMPDDKQERYFESCQRRLEGKNVTYIRKTSMEAVSGFEDSSLDFVYIDGRHDFDFVMEDLIKWSPKVKVGGIVSGHDYYHFPNGGVVRAVDAYTKAHNITLWYITREKEHSFFWVKE